MKIKTYLFNIVSILLIVGFILFILPACNKNQNPTDTSALYCEAMLKTVEIRCSSEGTNYSYATGSIISDKGDILTNKHVVMHNGQYYDNIEIRLYNENEYVFANIIKVSDTEDLALINININSTNAFLIGESVFGGENVYTIGNPNGFGLSFSAGKVSSPLRYVENGNDIIKTIQTSIVINEGNSGGPLFNENCDLIGLISFRLRNSSGEIIQGVSFAIHYTVLSDFIKE